MQGTGAETRGSRNDGNRRNKGWRDKRDTDWKKQEGLELM